MASSSASVKGSGRSNAGRPLDDGEDVRGRRIALLERGRRYGGRRACASVTALQHAIDIVLLQAFASSLRPVQQPVVFAHSDIRERLHLRGDVVDLEGDVVDAPNLDHGVDPLLDEAERLDHFLRALSGDVLKRAGRVDVGGALIELVAKLDLDAPLAQDPGDLLDHLGGPENIRSCLLGRLDDVLELSTWRRRAARRTCATA